MKAPFCRESRLAILIVSLFGMAAVYLVPPAITFDGPSHYFRALQVSEGRMRAEQYSDRAVGGVLPAAHVEFVNSLWSSYWDRHDFGTIGGWAARSRESAKLPGSARVEFTNTAVYSPANYLFQSLGMGLSALFTRSPLSADRMGCWLNLLGYLLVIVAAIEQLPRYREGALLVATSPLAVIQAASLSSDAVNFSAPLLVLACCWRLRAGNLRRPAWLLAAVLGLGLLVALLKPTSIAALVCLWLVPSGCFGLRISKAGVLSAYFLCAAAVWLAWNRANLNVDVARWFNPDVQQLAQKKQWFLEDPRRFVHPFADLLLRHLAPEWPNLYGGVGGWIPPGLQNLLAWLSLPFLFGLLACGAWEGRTDRLWAGGLLLQSFAILSLTALTLWLSFGSGGMETVEYLRGRYLGVFAVCAFAAWAEAFHRRFARLRGALYAVALLGNCAGLTVILVSIGCRVA